MIAIDSEFESLIPPLTEDEYKLLEESILAEGVHDPIITWNGTIIDGHNRYRICNEHGIEFTTKEIKFDSRDAAKIWIIKHQFGRRNLSSGQRAALAIDLNEAQVREQARMRQVKAGKETHSNQHKRVSQLGTERAQAATAEPQPADQPKPQKGRTADILGEMAGVGHMTIKRAMKVKQEDEELYDKVRKGEIPVTTAYEQVTGKKSHKRGRKPQLTKDGRRVCTICGEPIDDGDSYDYRPSVHKACHNKHTAELQYMNPDKALIENVAVYSTDSLIAELKSSAEMMRDAMAQSIAINESMGVSISRREKRQLDKAVSNIFKAIENISKD